MSILSDKWDELKDINYKDFFKRLYTKAFNEEEVLSVSAQVAFYFAFALFPLLLFLVSIFGIVMQSDNELRQEMFFYLQQVMPASAYDLVRDTIREVTENSSGGKITIGILAALWSASAGVDSLRNALNGIFNLTEERAWWKAKLVSLSMTLGLAALVTVALGVIFYGGKLVSTVLGYINLPVSSPLILGVLQGIIVLTVLLIVFSLIYNYLPHHKKHKWVWITPGAIVAIILWIILSYGFQLYLSYFGSYDKTYGSLGAVIILLLWLYLTALVILIGGSINAVLQEFTDKDTAEAAADKAAAKEVVENPEKGSAKTDKKAEVLDTLDKDSDDQTIDRKVDKTDLDDADLIVEKSPPTEKSTLKLVAGLIIGFVQNIRKK